MPAGASATPLRAAGSRRLRWVVLLIGVLLLHGSAVWWLEDVLVGWGAAQSPMPPRMEVAFVRTLTPAPPPVVAAVPAAPKPPRRARAAIAPASPASAAASVPDAEIAAVAPEAAASVPEAVVAASAPTPAQAAASAASAATEPAAAAAAAAAASAVDAVPFEWPPSTRLTYTLVGNYRGEIHGNARVQWVRVGSHYQVHLDVVVGLPFAPLMSRSMTSDGELGEQGLMPHRYDEVTKLPFQAPRRITMSFTPDTVILANGSIQSALPGVQDTASQFVQMTWLFTTRPDLLRVGNSIALPLALPRRLGQWTYDVLAEERLYTPVGAVDAFHLKPRRAAERPRGELSAEVWFAPTLQYLPVRIRIQQDADTFVDLMLDAAPLQAAPDGAPR